MLAEFDPDKVALADHRLLFNKRRCCPSILPFRSESPGKSL